MTADDFRIPAQGRTARVIGVVLAPRAIRDPASKVALGSGAFNLVRRSAFERTPGFEWLRLETGDDVALASMVKAHGGRLEVMDGRGSVRVDIYRDFSEFSRGVEKNGGTTAAHPVRFTLGMVVFLLTVRLSGFVSLGSLAGSAAILLFLPLLGAPPWKLQLAAFIVALIWAKHHENIGRLVRGTEKSWKQRDRAGE